MSNAMPIPPNIAQLTGPILLGHLFNWGLLGALGVQAYGYFSYTEETSISRAKHIAGTIFVIELAQTILSTKDAFNWFGAGFGQMEALDQVGLIWFSIPVMTGLVSCAIQLFYSWRIRMMSRSVYIPGVICLLALVQCSGAIWTGVQASELGHWSLIQNKNKTPTILWLVGTAICDVIITISMLYHLSVSRKGFASTNAVVVKLIRITIETGLITSTFAVLDLIIFLVFTGTNYYYTLAACLSKFYSNSLLVLLVPAVSRNRPQPVVQSYHLNDMSSIPGNDTRVNISVTKDTDTTSQPPSISKTKVMNLA